MPPDDTSKPCSRCKRVFPTTPEFFCVDKRKKFGIGAACRDCERKRVLEAQKKRYWADPKAACDYARDMRKKHPESVKQPKRKWEAEHPEQHRESRRLRNLRNREINRARGKQRYRDDPEPYKERARRRKAILAGVPCTLTQAEWEENLAFYDYSCAYCGTPWYELDRKLQREHIIPPTQGGGYTKENIVPACGSCNNHKRKRTPEQAGMKLIKRL